MILPQERLRQLVAAALHKAYPDIRDVAVTIEPTRDEKFGDYATSIAMKLAAQLGQPPLEIAKHLVTQLGRSPILQAATVAQPGFINFVLKPAFLMSYVPKVLAEKKFGTQDIGKGRKHVVEFISANPTGPMTLGNGRGAFSGDTMANILTMVGWKVHREFYVNDIGNQVNILGESVIRRYFQLKGIPTEYPDYCYQGEYVTELAKNIKIDKLKLGDMMTIRDRIKGRVLNTMIKEMQRVVEKKLKIHFDTWFRESALYEKKIDEKVLALLRRHDLLVEKDGALWFRTTAFGDDKDRVLIKKGGEKTYFLSDVALRWLRFAVRGFERELVYLGADHHGYLGRLKAIMAALGYAGQLEAEIVQLVRLLKDGQEVKMSKRAGTYVALEEVVDEVGLDVARFFFLMHSPNTHMDFDMNLAKEKSEKNPVFYVQYAGARMSSIFVKAKKLPMAKKKESPHQTELSLVRTLLQFPEVISEVATSRATQKLPFYCVELATKFHDFYTQCRVIDNGEIIAPRLQLVKATRAVLDRALAVIGVSAPEKM